MTGSVWLGSGWVPKKATRPGPEPESVGLHPKYKLAYFQSHQWEPEWIDTARSLIQDVWTTVYKPTVDPCFLQETEQLTVQDPVCCFILWSSLCSSVYIQGNGGFVLRDRQVWSNQH
jgi:hypothetical protein